MNDAELLELMAATDAYAADLPLLDTMTPESVLLAIERRTGMDLKQLTTPPAPARKRRGPLVGAAAFAMVAVFGAIWGLASSPAESPDDPAAPAVVQPAPATTAAPSTTLAPIPDGMETIVAALTAYSDGDVDALIGFVAPGAVLREGPHTQPNDVIDIDGLRLRAEFGAAIGERFEVTGCELETALTCSIAISDHFTRSLRLEPADGVMRFVVSDGQIVEWRVLKDGAFDQARILGMLGFQKWHASAYADDEQLYWPASQGVYVWWRSASTTEIVPFRVQEYLATFDG